VSDTVECVALFTHQVADVSTDVLKKALPILRDHGARLLLPPGEALKHPELRTSFSEGCCEVAREELRDADLCLVFGGDGTVLRALRMTRDLGVPVAGVNLGRVGYLATVERGEIEDDLPRLLAGDFVEQPLLGLTSKRDGATLRAVNDFVVGRGREGGICHLSYAVNGTHMFDLRCDAVIVATPAGSTAYNLAVGGPVVGLGVDGFVVSYVAPHTLTVRSVVVAATDTVTIRNESGHSEVDVLSDGEHVASLPPREVFEVRTTPALANLALLPGTDFYRHFAQRFT
jgi:NAD+ kinase